MDSWLALQLCGTWNADFQAVLEELDEGSVELARGQEMLGRAHAAVRFDESGTVVLRGFHPESPARSRDPFRSRHAGTWTPLATTDETLTISVSVSDELLGDETATMVVTFVDDTTISLSHETGESLMFTRAE